MTHALANAERIWQVVAAIPEGKVSTYGRVARMAGLPNDARFVGATLRNLPANTELPWHRVVNAQGKSAFVVGSEAYKEQKKRLEIEGVVFVGSKISLVIFGWNSE